MKNIEIRGREFEVGPERDPGGCSGCLLARGSGFEDPDVRRLCIAAPCEEGHPRNGKRGPFIVIREVTKEATPPAETPAPAGRKDDSGKLDMTLLDDMPLALKAVVEVMQWAVTDKKPVPYERGSWKGVAPDRYRAAILRHWRDASEQAYLSGAPARAQRDRETNLLHLAHIATSALMALENTLREHNGA